MGKPREDDKKDHDTGPKHRPSKSHPRKPERHGAPRRGLHYGVGAFGYYGIPTYGPGYYQGVLGGTTSTGSSGGGSVVPPTDGGQTGHLNPEQFVGFPGGYSTDAGNYTGVQAISGAEGNGGAGGTGGDGGGGGT